jgi:hypothetical protein
MSVLAPVQVAIQYPQSPSAPSAPPGSAQVEGQRGPNPPSEIHFQDILFGKNYKAWKSGFEKAGITAITLGAAGTLFSGVLIPVINNYPTHSILAPYAAKTAALPILHILVPSLVVLAVGVGLFVLSRKITAYNDLPTWTALRASLLAPQMNFKQIVDQHGLERVRRYHLLSLPALQQKYRGWVQNPATTGSFPLYDLRLHGIIDSAECDRLNALIGDSDRALQAGNRPRYLELRDLHDQAAGFPAKTAKQNAFRAQIQTLTCQTMFTLFPDPWSLALKRSVSTTDYVKLVELKSQLDAANGKESLILKVEDEFNSYFKRPPANAPHKS